MGRHQVHRQTLLAILVLLAMLLLGADSAEKKGVDRSEYHPVSASRLLRRDDDGGERGITAKVPGIEKLKNLFKPSAETAQIREWLKSGRSSTGAFVDLLIDSKVDEVLTNPNFKIWTKYVAKTHKQNPHAEIVRILTGRFEDKELATMLQAAKSVRGTKSIASKLQKAQFRMWFNERIRPGAVIEEIFMVVGPGWRGTSAHGVWRAYNTFLKTNKLSFD